jgi:hypothetical protein
MTVSVFVFRASELGALAAARLRADRREEQN